MADDFPVVVKAFVGHASRSMGGVRNLDIFPDYAHLKINDLSFSDDEYLGFVDMSFKGSTLTTYGASWIQYGSYDTEPYPFYLPEELGFTQYDNRGLAGRRPQDIAREAVSSGGLIPWDTTRRGVVLVDVLGNALIEEDTPLNRAAALEQTRALLALISASSRIEQTTFTFSTGWVDTASVQPYSSGGTTAIINSSGGSYVDIPVTADDTYILMHGTDGIAAPAGIFTFTQNGQPLGAKNLNGTTVKSDREANTGLAPVVYKLPAHDTGLVRAHYSDNGVAGAFGFLDGILPQSSAPPLILLMKPPRVTAPSHDKVNLYNYLRSVVDTLAEEFGKHVVVVDPLPGWDPDTMLGADKLHPTRLGTQHMTDVIVDTIHTRSWKMQIESLYGVDLD